MRKDLLTLRTRHGGVSPRRVGIVACVGLAVFLVLLSLAPTLSALDSSLTTWNVSARDVYVDDSGDVWFADSGRTAIVRLKPGPTSTLTTWPVPAGGTYFQWARTVSVDTSTQTVYFAEIINRPGLFSRAIGSLNTTTNDFIEWPFSGFSEIHTLNRDSAGNVWIAGHNNADAVVARLTPADNTVTQWVLPFAGFNYALDVLPMPDGTVFFTVFGPHHLARLDPANGNVTLWPLDFGPGLSPGSNNLHVDSAGDLWLSAGDRLVRLNPATDQMTTWPMTGIAVVTSHALDTQGRPVFGGQVASGSPIYGVGRLDVSSGLPTIWPFTAWGVRGVVVDSSDDVWVNTDDFKIHRVVE